MNHGPHNPGSDDRVGADFLASEVRRLRVERGLSQRELAARIGYTRQYVSVMERKGANLPSKDLVKAADHALGAEGYLVGLRERARLEVGRRRDAPGPDVPRFPDHGHLPPPAGLGGHDVEELVDHLREQWHLLVRTDNLFGPRFALSSVHDHLRLVIDLMRSVPVARRVDLVRLASWYAESAAWLHEDAAETRLAQVWTDRAMEWAHEGGDETMVAWTLFRRSQQAADDPGRVIGLATAAHRRGPELHAPMRAAITQQQARGHALAGDELAAHRALDAAHEWAAQDTDGAARQGHGSFCTPTYLELQRADCWLLLGRPDKAVGLYDAVLPSLPSVYRRDRGNALGRHATALARIGEPDRAADAALEALDIARSSGSVRTERAVAQVARALAPHGGVEAVSRLRDRLSARLA
ncbi:helix-turn-helix transcriptional regulator [Actinosynnema sp. NPDC020468]|uniref:helix-turn-helix transcriptional regulator n=1 Tax=Actinosynnema sp. NPDC020468 TaxID=3154488 RepID=UPI003410A8F8